MIKDSPQRHRGHREGQRIKRIFRQKTKDLSTDYTDYTD